jgi:hypothetical protein
VLVWFGLALNVDFLLKPRLLRSRLSLVDQILRFRKMAQIECSAFPDFATAMDDGIASPFDNGPSSSNARIISRALSSESAGMATKANHTTRVLPM